MSKVCILDYGSGNVKSVFNLFKNIGADVEISNDAAFIESASHIILPGVGAFAAAMQKIEQRVPMDAVKRCVFEKKVPFLGICVGMQVLADVGFEFGEYKGLGWVSGNVKKLSVENLPLPHIGWNGADIKISHPLLKGLASGVDFYFVHSFAYDGLKPEHCVATTNYGSEFPCILAKENIMGVQFHPEKSQKAGIALAKNFMALT